jgi:hypothetical protein
MNLSLTNADQKVPCPICERPFTAWDLMAHLGNEHPEQPYRLTISIEPVEKEEQDESLE